MKTVTEVSRLTGVSVRTLHHYDAIGLLKPARVTDAGYRLYDADALERLYMILVYRELGFSLREIQKILEDSDYDRNRVLEDQIRRMREKITHLENRITLAQGMQVIGVKNMEFNGFDPKQIDDYSAQAKALYGKTDAYKEYERKSRGRSKQQEKELGGQVMDFFVRLGQLRHLDPAAPECRAWAEQLQSYLTENFYTCTPQIFRCLAQSYAGGGSLQENIDAAGGSGTGEFAREVIECFLDSL